MVGKPFLGLGMTLVPQAQGTFGPRLDPGETGSFRFLRDRPERLRRLVHRAGRHRHDRLLEAELESGFQIGRPSGEQFLG
jgi:hypothetical protein